MTRHLATLFIVLALPLAACETLNIPTPANPAQTVFAARASYGAAFYGPFAQYAALPDCDTNVTPCSDDDAMIALNKANNSAKATLDAAEAVVRDDPNGDGAISWAKAAEEVVKAAQKILATYGIGA